MSRHQNWTTLKIELPSNLNGPQKFKILNLFLPPTIVEPEICLTSTIFDHKNWVAAKIEWPRKINDP